MVKDRSASSEQLAFLFETFAKTTESEQVDALMEDLCTIREINEMAIRLDVAKMLAQGESYLKIQEATGSSATTIARVSKCVNHGAGGYRKVFGLDQPGNRIRQATGAPSQMDGLPATGSDFVSPATGGRS